MDDHKHVNTDNARSEDQKSALGKIKEGNFCPFCSREYMETEHPHPIILENDYWFATKNRWQYEGAKVHLLLVYKGGHLTHPKEISDGAWMNLREITNQLCDQFSIPGGTFLMRFGDSQYTGATVTHLHAQIVSGSGDPDTDPILARVG